MPDSDSHDWLDAELRSVPLPANLLARLQQSGPRLGPSDQRLDECLRGVEIPQDLESRLRRIARPRYRPTPAWQRMALAASVFLVLGIGVVGYVAVIGGALGGGSQTVARQAATPAVPPAAAQPPQAVPVAAAPETAPGADRHPDEPAIRTPDNPSAVATVEGAPSAIHAQVDEAERPVVSDDELLTKPAARVAESAGTSGPASIALGAGGALDRLPELEALDAVVSRRGLAPPRTSGYDLLFQLKHGEHPFVSPAVNPDLASTRMPFTTSTMGYDLARLAVASGELPTADDVRVEDFIAAQNLLLPPAPASGLALHMAGAPSPLGKKGLYLMQVAVQTASRFARPHAPTRLVVAVETSWHMRTAGRWEATRRALINLAEHLGEGDRVTLIGFAESANVLAQNATGAELAKLLASDQLEMTGGSTDYVEAVEAAVELARAARDIPRQRAVFVVANRKRFSQAALASKQALAELEEHETRWYALCVAPTEHDDRRAEQNKAGDQVPSGTTVTVATAAAIEDVLGDALTDRPGTMASDATLRLAFNPKVVSGYRLLGHEAVTLTGGATDPVIVDLRADHATSGIYELWLKAGADDVIATAELDWHDPASRQARRISRPLRRSQVEASFSQSPPWFQQGVVAAKAAEALRGSFYAEGSKPLARVLELAEEVDPRVTRERAFVDLVTTIRQAEKLR